MRSSALVGIGPRPVQTPVLVVEVRGGCIPSPRRREVFRQELRGIARRQQMTAGIDRFLFHRGFPVDVRHNTKINREALAVWAAKSLS